MHLSPTSKLGYLSFKYNENTMMHKYPIIKVPADKSNMDNLCHKSMNRQHK